MNYPVSAEMQPSAASAEAPMTSTMSAGSYRFTRPGQRPLVFNGSQLAMAMSFTPDIPYWYEIGIFRTDAQQFVLLIKQFYQSSNETDYSQAWQFDSLDAVFDALETYDAADDVRVPFERLEMGTAAELAAAGLDLLSQVKARRNHMSSLVGELFDELEAAGQSVQ